MAIRDYWIYQERQNVDGEQWAIYVVKEYERGKKEFTCLDVTIYSEEIDSPTHSISFVGWQFDTVSGYVERTVQELCDFTIVHNKDVLQLEKAFTDIFFDRV